MFEELISGSATELGAVGVAIIAIVYIVKIFSNNHKEWMKAEREERRKNQEVFVGFVNSNNHKMTEHVKASTEALVETKKAIESHTENVRALTSAILKGRNK